MIGNRLEYQRMYDTEQKLWWYQILHEKVLKEILKNFSPKNRELKILDAACGTGGLLSFLKDHGYSNVKGFDYSQDAIEFSNQRGLDVSFGDLKKVELYNSGEGFDVIICNDALYFLTDEEIVKALTEFKQRLTSNGLIIINIHAFEAFSGTHDLAVGSSRRFQLHQFESFVKASGLKTEFHTYWPFLLSLPILLVRQWQRFQIRKNQIDISSTDSDVSYPGNLVNGILKAITKTESLIFKNAPFGSSLFMKMKIFR